MAIQLRGNIVNLQQQTIKAGIVEIADEKIVTCAELSNDADSSLPYLMPGFVDAHVHIESSLLVPSEFARMAVVHGTVATVSDPHEIANVCGMAGVEFMIQNGSTVPFRFYFGAPPCVPATTFETAGAVISADDVTALMQRPEIKYLSEVMNFPGVLAGDADMLAKIEAAKKCKKPIDGHAPGLRGEDARRYIAAGPGTDHECFTEAEAREKLSLGMKVLIREGSAAKNFEALIPLLHEYPNDMMFCSDDKHPDSLLLGHINQLCARAIAKGIPLFHVLKAACLNPVLHYGLEAGLLRKGDSADLIVVKDLKSFDVLQTYVQGRLVAQNGTSLIVRNNGIIPINHFNCSKKIVADFAIPSNEENQAVTMPLIEALEGQLITNKLHLPVTVSNGCLVSNNEEDVLKIVVVNRYKDAPVAKAFIKNFGLKRGALASSVAHDSHNTVAVGVDDESICAVVNAVIEAKGGLAVYPYIRTDLPPRNEVAHSSFLKQYGADAGISSVHQEDVNYQQNVALLPLPVAGLMSTGDAWQVAQKYTALDAAAKALGTPLSAPFMTLSFMALLVIPHLKLSDKGLFDGDSFELID